MCNMDYIDYLECRRKKIDYLALAKQERNNPVMRRHDIELAVMYRKHARQWLELSKM